MHAQLTNTVNPLYTETRYKDRIRYTDNLTSTETLSQEETVNQKLLLGTLLFNISSNVFFGYLLELPHRGNSNKYPKHTFNEEIRIKHGICCISFCSLRILYNSKFI